MTPFRPMLACDVDYDKLTFPKLASPKLDGIRCLVIGKKAISRSGKPIPNKYIQSVAKRWLPGLDGELIVGDPWQVGCFQRTTSGVMSEEGEPAFTFYVFDNFINPSLPYRNRTRAFQYIKAGVDHLETIEQWVLVNREDLDSYLKTQINQGYEGVILRSPGAPYKNGRSTMNEQYLVKVKPFKDAEGVVVGFEEMMHNDNPKERNELGLTKRSSRKSGKRPANCLGKLLLNAKAWDKPVAVGSGFTAKQRRDIWNNKALHIGKLARFKYQECGTKDKPRSPVFIGWRDERDLP